MDEFQKFRAIVIGVSAGGMKALKEILMHLPANLQVPVIIVQHMHAQSDGYFFNYLDKLSPLKVKEAEEKEEILPGHVYIAPANYHLLIEENFRFSLTLDEKVNYCRPAIDVLFESAADAFGPDLIGIILTGANNDGSAGMMRIKEQGGYLIVQDPTTAEVASMPMAVIRQTTVDQILPLEKIAPFIQKLIAKKRTLIKAG